ncbi:MAG: C2H2 type zinc finger domain-containing protein [Thermoplasmatales archaeon]
MNICPVCGEKFIDNKISTMSSHLYSEASNSDPQHVMWLNHLISIKKLSREELRKAIEKFYDFSKDGLALWIKQRFVQRFFSNNPNIFVLDMQNPTKYTIMGYVTEHYHFLKQWVKSCAYIIARTDEYDIQKYEVDNISEEYFGKDGKPPHVDLLIQMGESVGLKKGDVIKSKPLKKTRDALNYWEHVCSSEHWLDAMVSMHSLELIADKNVKQYGAKYSYFRPEILDGEITRESSNFLRAGYEADQYHSGEALKLIEYYANKLGMEREVQSYFLRSEDYFYRYLEARHERGELYEKEL